MSPQEEDEDIDARLSSLMEEKLARSAEAKTIRKVLLAVQRHERERIQEGLSELNFAAGVLNSMLVAYVFGHYPEHFWILWIIEAVALIPRKIWQDWHAKPLRQILYYLDYCWVMNFLMITALYCLTMDWSIPYKIRKNMYLAVLGVGCGPLLGATGAMPFVAMVFHDNRLMTSLFIHLTPPMLVYTFHWHADEIVEAWPSFFKLDVIDRVSFFPEQGPFFWPGQGLNTVAGNAMALYFLWFIPYVSWMVLMGLDLTRAQRRKRDPQGNPLPRSKYDTAFHSILRDGMNETIGQVCWGRSVEESRRQAVEGDYEVRDFLVIMVAHAMCCWMATTVVAYACLLDKRIHALFLWLIIVITVVRGAQRYVFWVTSMSSRAVLDEFAEVLQELN
jgi:hypothetical protein